MPPIDVCNAVAVRTVFLLSLITRVCSMAQTPVSEPPPVEKSSDWHLSAYADLAYLLDFNFPRTICGAAAPRVSESTNSLPTWAFSISRKR
jgi:hypothetical protein